MKNKNGVPFLASTHTCACKQMEHHLKFCTKWNFCAFAILTLLVPPNFGGASEKCQGEF
jgi:hypothetical protein